MLRRSLLALALLLACNRAPPPAPEPAPEAAAPAAETAPPPPEPPEPAPASSVVREAAAVQPGDNTTALSTDARTAVDPSATFRVVLAGRSADARLALHDAADAAVPAAARAEIGETTVLTLTPSEPLVPGSRYQLRLDGAVTRELHLLDRSFPPAIWALQASGDPPPARPPPRRRSRR